MIDNVTLRLSLRDVPQELIKYEKDKLVINNLILNASYNQIDIKYYSVNWKGLFVKVMNDYIIIQNSLHKFYHGNNYTDYTYSDLKDTIAILCTEFEVDPSLFIIKKIEIGINIPFEHHNLLTNNFTDIKNTEFIPMLHGGRKYGKKNSKSQFDVKVYDKTLQVKLKDGVDIDKDVLRFEIVIKNMNFLYKRANQIPLYTLKDFEDINLLLKLGELLTETYRNISKITVVIAPDTPPNIKKEIYLLTSDKREAFLNDLRLNNPETLKKFRDSIKKLIHSNPVLKEVYDGFEEIIWDTWFDLVNR